MGKEHVDIVFEDGGFDGMPKLRFIEVEVDGKSIRLGEWITRPDGLCALRITKGDIERLEDTIYDK